MSWSSKLLLLNVFPLSRHLDCASNSLVRPLSQLLLYCVVCDTWRSDAAIPVGSGLQTLAHRVMGRPVLGRDIHGVHPFGSMPTLLCRPSVGRGYMGAIACHHICPCLSALISYIQIRVDGFLWHHPYDRKGTFVMCGKSACRNLLIILCCL